LNDRFDNNLRRIKIRDSAESIDDLLIYPNAELKPIHLGQVVMYPSSQWGQQPFLVILPLEFQNEEPKIRRILDNYKFLGTKYKIIYE
jgi:hypothetical protein